MATFGAGGPATRSSSCAQPLAVNRPSLSLDEDANNRDPTRQASCSKAIQLFENSSSVAPAGVLKGGRLVIDRRTKQVQEVVVDMVAAADLRWKALEEVLCFHTPSPLRSPAMPNAFGLSQHLR
jgi:hypothetical protein